jgi:hypothetical protein
VLSLSKQAGLCADCRHARRIRSGRGSMFVLCGRAAADPHYARYPPLPVLRCPGHEAVDPDPDTAES